MSTTLQISEEAAARLAEQAAAHGLSLEAWIEALAAESTSVSVAVPTPEERQRKTRAAVKGILKLQKRVKPDRDGWTIRNYIEYGRR